MRRSQCLKQRTLTTLLLTLVLLGGCATSPLARQKPAPIKDRTAQPAPAKIAEAEKSAGDKELLVAQADRSRGATSKEDTTKRTANAENAVDEGVESDQPTEPDLQESFVDPSLSPELLQWQRYLQHYLNFGTLQDTMTLTYAYPADTVIKDRQAHLTWRMIRSLDMLRLQALYKQQPADRPLITPFLALALGDARWRSGATQEARDLWRKTIASAQWKPLAREARRRLAPNRQSSLNLGLLLPISGQYQKLGSHLTYSVQQALRDHPDVGLTMLVGDTQGGEEQTEKAVHGLVVQGAQLIIGPVFQQAAVTAARTAVQLKRPIMILNPRGDIADIDPASTMPGKRDRLIHLNAFDPEQQAREMARYAVEHDGRKRIALLAPESDYGKLSVLAFRKEAQRLGAKVLDPYYFPSNSRDFSPWLKRLVHLDKESVNKQLRRAPRQRSLDPADPPPPMDKDEVEPWADFDAIYLPVPAQQARLAAPQLAFFNVRTPRVAMLGMPLWNTPELMAEGTDYLKGALFCDLPQGRKKQFEKNFEKNWGEPPTPLAILAYDGATTIIQLLRDLRMEGVDFQHWRSQLTRPEGFSGATGPMRFLKNGRSERNYLIYQVGDREILPVPPPQPKGS
uniref:Putative ABC-type branched-chain amino acid transport systems periplasmic component-like protein n=1 Tax=Magnetococcus massalia (strain MO-1) TaxID=451514 RepID=A0A1S7LPB6_MAGMO|nr:putative ABC-type branched-chain amino acid transport systems periplasmic component-like protein [Candidatus Magnetococcus massalia]